VALTRDYGAVGALHLAGRHDTTEAARDMGRPFTIPGLTSRSILEDHRRDRPLSKAASQPEAADAAPGNGNVAAQGHSAGGRRPHAPMWTNPHAKKSSSPGRPVIAVACSRLSAPACTFGRARAAWLSW
jgi:hypothetical protein